MTNRECEIIAEIGVWKNSMYARNVHHNYSCTICHIFGHNLNSSSDALHQSGPRIQVLMSRVKLAIIYYVAVAVGAIE